MQHEYVTPEQLTDLITATDILAAHLGRIEYAHEDDERIAGYLAEQLVKHAVDLESAFKRRSPKAYCVAGTPPTA